MTLEQYARQSPYSIREWVRAHELLKGCGFSEEDTDAVLHAAWKMQLGPYGYALAAAQLRSHVNAGVPLNA